MRVSLSSKAIFRRPYSVMTDIITKRSFLLAFAIILITLPLNIVNTKRPVEQPMPRIECFKDINVVSDLKREEEALFINQGKTYLQCMNEAFERIYAEVNMMLDMIVEERISPA